MASSEEKSSKPIDASTTGASCAFDPSADPQGDAAVSDDVPTKDVLDRAAGLTVLNADGSSRSFGSLYSEGGAACRVLIIFVRHFFCGNCQAFIHTLSSSIDPASLLSLSVPTSIAIVGCGRPELIPMYVEATKCPFPVYADPSRKLYDQLGMLRTLSLGSRKPDYMRNSILSGILRSMIQSLRSGTGAVKGGDLKQVGGEFMFEDGKVAWCHRMKNTRDHSEIPELRRVLGLKSESDENATDGASKSVDGMVVGGGGDSVDPHKNANTAAASGTTNGKTTAGDNPRGS
ncbi:hypothetical protein GP486_000076 [Trichoglossum hirsutum]|uniref:Uncharacterized protein n=1 Tax=Trichoglossum hirsutum TaxID=265104 RepID=A0A9P8RTX5_9PEZI|nr:hypothetical protein GP486_000076 [Trichoglossum hirsutum]